MALTSALQGGGGGGRVILPSLEMPTALWITFQAKIGDSTGSNAVILDGQGGLLRIERETGTGAWLFSRPFTGSGGGRARWRCAPSVFSFDYMVFHFAHDGSSAVPLVIINGAAQTVTEDVAPAGSLVLGASDAIHVLNSIAGGNAWGGNTSAGGGVEGLAIYGRMPAAGEMELINSDRRYPLAGLLRFYDLINLANALRDVAAGQTATAVGFVANSESQPTIPLRYWPAPASPSATPAAGATDTTLSVSWASVAGAASYLVERLDGASWVAAGTPSAPPLLVTGLTPSTSYSFRITTRNALPWAGLAGATFSGATTATPPPQTPIITSPTPVGTGAAPLQTLLLDERGRALYDLSHVAEEAQIETNEHGDHSATVSARLPFVVASALADQSLGAQLLVSASGEPIWRGRVEEPMLRDTDEGTFLEVTAYGPQVALDDTPYTAVWSDDDPGAWLDAPRIVGASDRRFEMDNSDGLSILLKKGETYNPGHRAEFLYRLPQGRITQQLGGVQFGWNRFGLTDFAIEIRHHDRFFNFDDVLHTIPPSAGTSGYTTIPLDFTGLDFLSICLAYVGGAPFTNTVADGAAGLFVSDPRVVGDASGFIGSDMVVRDILATAISDGRATLSPSVGRIAAPGDDRYAAVYHDASRREVLDELATGLGWSWGISSRGVLWFGPAPTGGRYVARISTWEAGEALEDIYREVYAVIEDWMGFRDASPIYALPPRNGIARRRIIESKARYRSLTIPEVEAAFNDLRAQLPRISMEPHQLLTANGGPVPLWRLRAHDLVSVPDLAPALGGKADKLRTFRVTATSYDLVKDRLRLTLERPQPELARLLAQRDRGR